MYLHTLKFTDLSQLLLHVQQSFHNHCQDTNYECHYFIITTILSLKSENNCWSKGKGKDLFILGLMSLSMHCTGYIRQVFLRAELTAWYIQVGQDSAL